MNNIPWLPPGMLLSLVVAALASARVARALRSSRWAAVFLVASAGLVIVATLTPTRALLEDGFRGSGVCDLRRFGPPSIREWLSLGDPALNVILYVPLGLAIASLRPGRRLVAVFAAAAASPILIEGIQLYVRQLGRGCQSGDVFDNLLGLTVGLVVGGLVHLAAGSLGEPSDPS